MMTLQIPFQWLGVECFYPNTFNLCVWGSPFFAPTPPPFPIDKMKESLTTTTCSETGFPRAWISFSARLMENFKGDEEEGSGHIMPTTILLLLIIQLTDKEKSVIIF